MLNYIRKGVQQYQEKRYGITRVQTRPPYDHCKIFGVQPDLRVRVRVEEDPPGLTGVSTLPTVQCKSVKFQ